MSPAGGARYAHPQVSAAWTPASIPNLVAWYNASNAASITSSGGAVSQWNDLSGNTNHLVQATLGNKPTTGTRTLNSLNVLDFDGSNDWMAVTFTTVAQPLTILGVVVSDINSSGTFQDSNDAASRVQTYERATAKLALYAGSAEIPTHTTTNGVAFQYVAIVNGASSLVYKGGSSFGAISTPGAQSLHGLTVGSDSSRAGPLDGAIGELVVVSAAISSGDRTSWDTYCARWGL